MPDRVNAEQGSLPSGRTLAIARAAVCIPAGPRSSTVKARLKPGWCLSVKAPDLTRTSKGRPFVGRAGKLLDKMIKALGFKREEVYIC